MHCLPEQPFQCFHVATCFRRRRRERADENSRVGGASLERVFFQTRVSRASSGHEAPGAIRYGTPAAGKGRVSGWREAAREICSLMRLAPHDPSDNAGPPSGSGAGERIKTDPGLR